MADERDEIRSRINIVDLVGQSVLLKKTGKAWKGLCPFHADKNPSFTVDPTFGTYRCWSCGEHGDIFTWVMKNRRVEFAEALQILAEQAGVTLDARSPRVSKDDRARWREAMKDALSYFREQLAKNETARAYCDRRSLSPEVISGWEIGYAPDVDSAMATLLKKKGHSLTECRDLFLVAEDSAGGFSDKFKGRLMFPIRNDSGELVAFGGRLLGEGTPKYINSSDTPLYKKSRVLYGMNRAKDAIAKEHRAVLVEGYLDVIACHSAGVNTAVASLGTSMTEDQAKLLRRWCDEVVILYDSDAAGQKAADRAVEILQAEGLRTKVALMPPGEDPDTLLKNLGPSAVKQAVDAGLRPVDYKFKKLLAARKPTDDAFMEEAIEIVAGSTTEMELDRYVVQLAAISPGVTDQMSAQRALRAEVGRYRKRKRSVRNDEEPARPINPFRSIPLHPSELAIFRALLEPSLKQLAWNLCEEIDLFPTEPGKAVAQSVRDAFPIGPPAEKANVWVAKLEPDSVRETFMAAQYDGRAEGNIPEYLDGAIARLRDLQRTREIQLNKRDMEGDERLRTVHEKLKSRQPGA